MHWNEYFFFLLIVVGLAWPVGRHLARVCERKRTFLDRVLRPIELLLYRVTGVQPEQEMTVAIYITSFLLFGAAF